MTLGPVGEATGITAGSLYILAIGQLPAMFVCLLHFSVVKGDFFSTSARIVPNPLTNGTAVDLHNPTILHYMHSIHLQVPFMGVSALAAFFSLVTISMREKGLNHDGSSSSDLGYEDYVSSNTSLIVHPTVGMWNNSFIALVIVSHGILCIVVNSPTSIHFLLLVILLVYVSMKVILQPRIQYDADAGQHGASIVASIYLVAVSVYCLAMIYIGTNIPHDPNSYKIQLVALIAFLDCFLLILGHTWDPVPNMCTVMNCRLLYMSCIVIINISLYVLWDPYLRVPFINMLEHQQQQQFQFSQSADDDTSSVIIPQKQS